MSIRLKKSWLISLMIFIMSWASFANAYILQTHQALPSELALESDHAEHLTHVHNAVDFHNAASQNVLSQEIASQLQDCHSQAGDAHHQAQHNLQHQDNAKYVDQMKHSNQSCQDCHVFHCQLASSGLIPELIGLSLPHKIEYLHNIRTSYDSRHLAGYSGKILRPPKA